MRHIHNNLKLFVFTAVFYGFTACNGAYFSGFGSGSSSDRNNGGSGGKPGTGNQTPGSGGGPGTYGPGTGPGGTYPNGGTTPSGTNPYYDPNNPNSGYPPYDPNNPSATYPPGMGPNAPGGLGTGPGGAGTGGINGDGSLNNGVPGGGLSVDDGGNMATRGAMTLQVLNEDAKPTQIKIDVIDPTTGMILGGVSKLIPWPGEGKSATIDGVCIKNSITKIAVEVQYSNQPPNRPGDIRFCYQRTAPNQIGIQSDDKAGGLFGSACRYGIDNDDRFMLSCPDGSLDIQGIF